MNLSINKRNTVIIDGNSAQVFKSLKADKIDEGKIWFDKIFNPNLRKEIMRKLGKNPKSSSSAAASS